VAELAELADRLLEAAGQPPERPTTDRTVRFYVTRRVLQPPFGQGPGSAWGYPHLVELLAARLAQRAGEPLEAIATRRATLSPEALERQAAQDLGVAVPGPVDRSPPVSHPAGVARQVVVEPGVELHLAADHPLSRDDERLGTIVDRLAKDIASRIQET
jgi:hypothetical protein